MRRPPGILPPLAGLCFLSGRGPTAEAVGYSLSPLRGWGRPTANFQTSSHPRSASPRLTSSLHPSSGPVTGEAGGSNTLIDSRKSRL